MNSFSELLRRSTSSVSHPVLNLILQKGPVVATSPTEALKSQLSLQRHPTLSLILQLGLTPPKQQKINLCDVLETQLSPTRHPTLCLIVGGRKKKTNTKTEHFESKSCSKLLSKVINRHSHPTLYSILSLSSTRSGNTSKNTLERFESKSCSKLLRDVTNRHSHPTLHSILSLSGNTSQNTLERFESKSCSKLLSDVINRHSHPTLYSILSLSPTQSGNTRKKPLSQLLTLSKIRHPTLCLIMHGRGNVKQEEVPDLWSAFKRLCSKEKHPTLWFIQNNDRRASSPQQQPTFCGTLSNTEECSNSMNHQSRDGLNVLKGLCAVQTHPTLIWLILNQTPSTTDVRPPQETEGPTKKGILLPIAQNQPTLSWIVQENIHTPTETTNAMTFDMSTPQQSNTPTSATSLNPLRHIAIERTQQPQFERNSIHDILHTVSRAGDSGNEERLYVEMLQSKHQQIIKLEAAQRERVVDQQDAALNNLRTYYQRAFGAAKKKSTTLRMIESRHMAERVTLEFEVHQIKLSEIRAMIVQTEQNFRFLLSLHQQDDLYKVLMPYYFDVFLPNVESYHRTRVVLLERALYSATVRNAGWAQVLLSEESERGSVIQTESFERFGLWTNHRKVVLNNS